MAGGGETGIHSEQDCFKPLYIFRGDCPVVAALRTAESEHLEDTLRLIEKIAAALRKRFGRGLEILIRGDNEICRQEIMLLCEALKIRYVLGLRNNPCCLIEADTEKSFESGDSPPVAS